MPRKWSPGGSLEAPWAALGRFGGTVGSFGGLLGRPVELLGRSLGALGSLWELLGVILGAFWNDFGAVFPSTTRSALFYLLCSSCYHFSYFLNVFCKFFNMAEVLPARAGSSGSDLGHSRCFSVFIYIYLVEFCVF